MLGMGSNIIHCKGCGRSGLSDTEFCWYCGLSYFNNTRLCLKCGEVNDPVSKKCNSCQQDVGEGTAADKSDKNETYICPKCRNTFSDGKRFCEDCGVNLEKKEEPKAVNKTVASRFCPKCKNTFWGNKTFCEDCGIPLEKKEAPKPIVKPSTAASTARVDDSKELVLKSYMLYDEYWYVLNIINTGGEKSVGGKDIITDSGVQLIDGKQRKEEERLSDNIRTIDIEPVDLYETIKTIIRKVELPVRAVLRETRWEVPFEDFGEVGTEQFIRQYLPESWYKQFKERRKRLVVYLEDHFYSMYKFVIGMDKLGKFVIIQTQLMEEPPEEKLALPQKTVVRSAPDDPGSMWLVGGIAGVIISIFLIAAIPPVGVIGVIFSIIIAIYGSQLSTKSKEDHIKAKRQAEEDYNRQKASFEKYHSLKETMKEILKASRGFKDDDLRILCHSIQKVVDFAVKDLFIARGAKIDKSGVGEKGKDSNFAPGDSGMGGI